MRCNGYCVHALHMSEAEAYLRIRAARLGREYPRVLLMLEAGELNLITVKLLAPVLAQHDADQWLDAARCKSKREIEEMIAARFEKPGVPNVIRRLPQKSAFPAPTHPLRLHANWKRRRTPLPRTRQPQSPGLNGSSCSRRLQPVQNRAWSRSDLRATSCS
jgi:hypothetical protein